MRHDYRPDGAHAHHAPASWSDRDYTYRHRPGYCVGLVLSPDCAVEQHPIARRRLADQQRTAEVSGVLAYTAYRFAVTTSSHWLQRSRWGQVGHLTVHYIHRSAAVFCVFGCLYAQINPRLLSCATMTPCFEHTLTHVYIDQMSHYRRAYLRFRV